MKFLLESTLVLHHGRPRTRVPKVVQEPNSRPRNTKGNTQPELGAGPPIVAHLLGRAGLLMVAVLTVGAVLVEVEETVTSDSDMTVLVEEEMEAVACASVETVLVVVASIADVAVLEEMVVAVTSASAPGAEKVEVAEGLSSARVSTELRLEVT